MAKVTVTEEQFKYLCRNMLKESRKEDYVKNLLKEGVFDGERGVTSSGLKYETLDPSEINVFSDEYDRNTAQCHIQNVGKIIVYAGKREPIDNEYDLEEIYSDIENAHRR